MYQLTYNVNIQVDISAKVIYAMVQAFRLKSFVPLGLHEIKKVKSGKAYSSCCCCCWCDVTVISTHWVTVNCDHVSTIASRHRLDCIHSVPVSANMMTAPGLMFEDDTMYSRRRKEDSKVL